jgi:hypothetical protein
MAIVTNNYNAWGPPAPDLAAAIGTPIPDDPTWPGADLAAGWAFQAGDVLPITAPGFSAVAASQQFQPPGCVGPSATLTVSTTLTWAGGQLADTNPINVGLVITDGSGNIVAGPVQASSNDPGSPVVVSLPFAATPAQAAAGLWASVVASPADDNTPLDVSFPVTATSELTVEYDDAQCTGVAGCVGEATHLDDCGVDQFASLLQQTVNALRPQVRWDCACDSGAANTVVWQKFSSTDNGLTWTLLGTFTEKYGTVPYVPVGVLVNCCDIGVAPTGKRARRTVLGVGSTVVPTGLPLVGALVESLSWSSRNATGTITDAAGTVSSFVAGEGGTWELEWIDTMTFDVTTGEVVIDWIEVY